MKKRYDVIAVKDGITQKDDNGMPAFFTKNGQRIVSYHETVEDIVGCGLEHIETIFDVIANPENDLDDKDVNGLGYAGKELVESLTHKLEQHIKYIKEHYGIIAIERATYNQSAMEGGVRLAVIFTPKAGE
ncbi:MAG TPA: hypothetical protein PLO63_13725 [Syntrophales bacterium]|nr:hypothetical protein [Syntrophales bacterium]